LKATCRAGRVSFEILNFNLDATWLFLSLFPGGIGFVLMVYGKKQERWVHVLFGALFTVYPFFTESATSLILVGVALGVALWWAVKQGY
jgi:hypothetical protein